MLGRVILEPHFQAPPSHEIDGPGSHFSNQQILNFSRLSYFFPKPPYQSQCEQLHANDFAGYFQALARA